MTVLSARNSRRGDLLVRQARGDEAEDLPLAVRQRRRAHRPPQLLRHDHEARQDGADRERQALVGCVVEQDRGRAGLEQRAHLGAAPCRQHDDDRRLRLVAPQRPDAVDADLRAAREDDDVRIEQVLAVDRGVQALAAQQLTEPLSGPGARRGQGDGEGRALTERPARPRGGHAAAGCSIAAWAATAGRRPRRWIDGAAFRRTRFDRVATRARWCSACTEPSVRSIFSAISAGLRP